MLEGAVDIYLPDYKYIDPNMAAMLSGAADGTCVFFFSILNPPPAGR